MDPCLLISPRRQQGANNPIRVGRKTITASLLHLAPRSPSEVDDRVLGYDIENEPGFKANMLHCCLDVPVVVQPDHHLHGLLDLGPNLLQRLFEPGPMYGDPIKRMQHDDRAGILGHQEFLRANLLEALQEPTMNCRGHFFNDLLRAAQPSVRGTTHSTEPLGSPRDRMEMGAAHKPG